MPHKNIIMEKVIVDIYYTGNNYCAYAPILPGCVSTAATLSEIKKNIKEAIEFHVESSIEDNSPIPEIFKGEYLLEFKISTEALLNAYSEIFTKAALSRITGINERQLWHYASGMRKPRPAQRKRIEDGLHRLGAELLTIGI
jgi:predicted RNase H-like HicB family nuclease